MKTVPEKVCGGMLCIDWRNLLSVASHELRELNAHDKDCLKSEQMCVHGLSCWIKG